MERYGKTLPLITLSKVLHNDKACTYTVWNN